jgi:putative membrane protein
MVLAHTVTFRQARQILPVVLPILAATGLGGGTTVVALAVGITLVSLAAAALSWWRFGYTDGPAAVVVTRGLVTRSVRTVPNDRIRGMEVEAPCCTGSSVSYGCGSTRPQASPTRTRKSWWTASPRPRETGCASPSSPSTAPHGATPEAPAQEPVEEELSRWDNRWLRYASLVGGYLAVPLAGVGALFRLADELPGDFLPDVDARLPAAWM